MPKRVKQRTSDVNEIAFNLVKQSTEEQAPPRKRAKKLPSTISDYMSKIGSRGGRIGAKRRAEKLTPEQRSEIAHKAAQARWKKD